MDETKSIRPCMQWIMKWFIHSWSSRIPQIQNYTGTGLASMLFAIFEQLRFF